MGIENPQGSSTTPSLEELLEKARQEDESRKVVPSPEVSAPVAGEAPTSMEELLKGLQDEVKDNVAETVKAEPAKVVESEPLTPVKETMVEKKETPEEKAERERRIAEVEESTKQLVVKSDAATGRDAYAVLSGNSEVYRKAVSDELQSMIAREENRLKSTTLEFAGRNQDSPLDRTTNTTIKEALAGLKSGVEDHVNSLKERLDKLNDPKEVEDMMKRDKERMKDGQGVWKKGETGGFAVTQDRQNIEDANGLIRALTERVDKVFDYRKTPGGGGLRGALEFGDYPMESTRVLKGVGLAALEAGDVETAAKALAFSELINPMSPEEMREMVGAIAKLTPEQKRGFVKEMDAEKKKPHREYQKEVEMRSEKPIYSR